MKMENESDPNVDRVMQAFNDPEWFNSKCRQEAAQIYRKWSLEAAKDAGLDGISAEIFDHGITIGIRGFKDEKRHVGMFYLNGSVIADIWNWAKAC